MHPAFCRYLTIHRAAKAPWASARAGRRPAPVVVQLGLVARPPARHHGPHSLADGFRPPPAPMPSRWRNDRLWAAPESCPRLDQGSIARPPGGGFQPGLGSQPRGFRPRARQPARAQAPDRRLDPNRAAASFRGETACLSRLRSGAKLSPGLAPTLPGLLQAHPIEGQETGRERLLPLIERPLARI